MTGLLTPFEQAVTGSESDLRRPQSLSWITDELLAETIRVWSLVYGCELTAGEAVEILQNVKRLAEVIQNNRGERREL